jgi:hypothetical protein
MRLWRVVLLLNLALAVGLGAGYVAWGRKLAAVEAEIKATQTQADRLRRERDACFAGGRPGEQLWEGRGIVRAVYPRLALITHEEIPGMLPARTTSFRLSDAVDRALIRPGDAIRFWLLGPDFNDTALVRAERW